MAVPMDVMKTTFPEKINRRKQWDDGETFCLLKYYKKAKTEVRNNKRRRLRYDEIAVRMRAEGFTSRNGKEVKKKIENLLKKYREEKGKIMSTGGAPSRWKYFSSIQEAVGYLPSLDGTIKMEPIQSDDENEASVEQSFVSESLDMEPFCNMNSQKSGSDVESVDVSTVFLSFRLEWKIPSETILDNKHVPRKLLALPNQPTSTPYDDLLITGLPEMNATPTTVENSKWFEFKDLKIPPFYLELSYEKCYDDSGEMPSCRVNIMTKDPNHRSAVRLNYALVCRGDRIYRLAGDVKQEATLDALRGICREQKCLTVVCQVTAQSDVRGSSADKCANDVEKMALECAFPSRHSIHMTSSSPAEEAIDKYLVSGALPSLDVALARELLLNTSKGGQVLRALSAEFLTRNLDDENVAGVWAFATEHRVQSLMVECGRYMAKHWNKASSDSGEKAMEQHQQKNFLFSNVYCTK